MYVRVYVGSDRWGPSTYMPTYPQARVAFSSSVRGMVGDLRWVEFDLVDLDTGRTGEDYCV